MSYEYLELPVLEQGFVLRALDLADMERVRVWRNEQMHVLRQKKELTKEDQIRYYQERVLKSFKDKRTDIILLGFLKNEELIGYGGLVSIDWEHRRGEVSFLLDTRYSKDVDVYREYGVRFFKMMQALAFGQLGFRRLYAETFDIRPDHVKVLEEAGFEYEGRMRDHVMIEEKYVDSLMHGVVHG